MDIRRFFPLTCLCAVLCLSAPIAIHSQTIEEKEKALSSDVLEQDAEALLSTLTKEMKHLRRLLNQKYVEVQACFKENSSSEAFENKLKEVQEIKQALKDTEVEWREVASHRLRGDSDYTIWYQEDPSLNQLIIDYGSSDYLYIIPQELSAMKIHIHSGIPIPNESWSELLEVILAHNGVGIKEINPYTRQLYVLKQDLVALDAILSDPVELNMIPQNKRIVYIFSPPPEQVKNVCQFFERFRDPKMTFVHQLGYKIAVVSTKAEIEKFLALYQTVWEKENGKVTKMLSLSRVNSSEMERILKAYFSDGPGKARASKGHVEELTCIPLKGEGSIVLVGAKSVVDRAESIVKDVESQAEDPTEMTVYWYTCRHSDPIDVAEVLEKVYTSLVYSGVDGVDGRFDYPLMPPIEPQKELSPQLPPPTYGSPPYSSGVHPPTAVAATIEAQKEKSTTTNFIPYPKTGSIMMVVRRDTLDKIKELLRKLDVPKKMVQIEVLLFEKRMTNKNNFGLNMLKLGSAASNTHQTGLGYDNGRSIKKGILDFFIFREKPSSFWPAFDIAYNFLMAQEDVRINAAPSVTTLNQTPAQIALVQEISIDNGAAPIETNKDITFEKSFSRAQYGTTLVMTPTIHDPELPEDKTHFVTLETNITFDTIKKTSPNKDRPDVSRRHIENSVRVADGETVILGGLREKTGEDSSNKLPFLGELPGLGKFFGDSRMTDEKTEMFIFITPKIIFDAKGELEEARNKELMKRPGDLPEFLDRINNAKKKAKKRLFDNSLKLMFGTVDG